MNNNTFGETLENVDFSIMRDEDYVKNLVVSNVFTENISHFAEISQNVADKLDMSVSNAHFDTEGAKSIKKVRKTRPFTNINP